MKRWHSSYRFHNRVFHLFRSFYSSNKSDKTPVNVVAIPDGNISEDHFEDDDQDSDYQPDNMEVES